jgi:branched-chain amino acid transport system permease protein
MNGRVRKSIPWQQHWLGLVLIGVVLLAVPFVAALGGQAWVRIANFAILYVFLALGLNIVVGYAGLLDLGYVAFYAVGAYAYALLASPHFGIHLPFWVILPDSVPVLRASSASCSVLRRSSCGATTWRS